MSALERRHCICRAVICSSFSKITIVISSNKKQSVPFYTGEQRTAVKKCYLLLNKYSVDVVLRGIADVFSPNM